MYRSLHTKRSQIIGVWMVIITVVLLLAGSTVLFNTEILEVNVKLIVSPAEGDSTTAKDKTDDD